MSPRFFRQESYLTVSGQLEGEILRARCHIYTFGPTFRAENSTRHAMPRILDDRAGNRILRPRGNMAVAEEFVKYLIRDAREHWCGGPGVLRQFVDKDLLARLDFVLDRPSRRCSYTDAIDILAKAGRQWEHPVTWGDNLQSEHERFLARSISSARSRCSIIREP